MENERGPSYMDTQVLTHAHTYSSFCVRRQRTKPLLLGTCRVVWKRKYIERRKMGDRVSEIRNRGRKRREMTGIYIYIYNNRTKE